MTRISKRWLILSAALLVLIAVLAPLLPLSGCRNLNTHIAERRLYRPATTQSSFSATEDWPGWLGPWGDGISRETNLAETWPEGGPPQLWSADVGLGHSSPIAAGGRIFLFTMNNRKETLTCFDAASGSIIWSDESDIGWVKDYPGTRATPAIDGGRIFTLGAQGELISRDASSGKPLWRVNILKETGSGNLDYGTASSPLIARGLLFVQGGAGGNIAIAIRPQSGEVAWRSQAVGVAGYAHPIVADVAGTPQLVVFGGEAVLGMNPDTGQTIWQVAWPTRYHVNSSTPVYADGHLFITSSYGQGCMMLELSPGGAKKLWSNHEVKSKFQQVIRDGGLLFANSEGMLKCLSWPDGAVKWGSRNSSTELGENGSILRVGDKLILTSDQGKLSLVRATEKGVEPLAQAQPLSAQNFWSVPLLYGGRLYVKGEQELVCFDVSGRK